MREKQGLRFFDARIARGRTLKRRLLAVGATIVLCVYLIGALALAPGNGKLQRPLASSRQVSC